MMPFEVNLLDLEKLF